MQNFYELENLIENKRLQEGINDRVVGTSGRRAQDYVQPIGKGLPWKASDGFGGGSAATNPELVDIGAKLPDRPDAELPHITQWKQENPQAAAAQSVKHDLNQKIKDQERASSAADREAEADVGLQHVIRKGTGVKDVVRTSQNDMRMKLTDPKSPHSQDPAAPNALKLQAALFQQQYFGTTFELPDLFRMVISRTKMDISDIKPALRLLQQVAGDQMRVFKGIPFPKIQIVDPFALGGAGSTPETPDVDAEDIHTATGGAQFVDRPDPTKSVAGGPQKLAPQNSKWQEVEGKANQALLKYGPGRELPDPKEIESIINDLKSVASEYPEKAREIKGYLDTLGEMIPQREWVEIFESMCLNGI